MLSAPCWIVLLNLLFDKIHHKCTYSKWIRKTYLLRILFYVFEYVSRQKFIHSCNSVFLCISTRHREALDRDSSEKAMRWTSNRSISTFAQFCFWVNKAVDLVAVVQLKLQKVIPWHFHSACAWRKQRRDMSICQSWRNTANKLQMCNWVRITSLKARIIYFSLSPHDVFWIRDFMKNLFNHEVLKKFVTFDL